MTVCVGVRVGVGDSVRVGVDVGAGVGKGTDVSVGAGFGRTVGATVAVAVWSTSANACEELSPAATAIEGSGSTAGPAPQADSVRRPDIRNSHLAALRKDLA